MRITNNCNKMGQLVGIYFQSINIHEKSNTAKTEKKK